jgi:hypothetical protein
MTDWITIAASVYFVAYLGSFVWAWRHQDNPFWGGFLDGLTLRFVWRAWHNR